jgi:1-acyl-sn-glycerol-3-phosphate acyltransferase
MFINFLYKLAQILIRFILRINGGIIVKGMENIPAAGGVIIAANHISYIDPPLIGAVLPRRATFMARKGLFEMPLLSWIMKQTAIPVDRQRTLPSTIKEAVRRLKSGDAIVLFPEGKRSETGDLLEGKRGIGMLTSLSRVPVVPTLIKGTDRALPVDARWLKRARITVVFDKPIYYTFRHEENYPVHLIYEDISKKIMTAIGELKKCYANNSR